MADQPTVESAAEAVLDLWPYICTALVFKIPNASTRTSGTRATVILARSEEEALGIFVKDVMKGGWSVDIIEAKPMGLDLAAEISACYRAKHHVETRNAAGPDDQDGRA